jgi:tRNA(fMet)-specific endonuclease VapC
MYLLDTNILSDLVRHPQGVIGANIAQGTTETIVTSIIVASELRFGAERRILKRLPVLPLEDDADRHYGALRAELERQGKPIGGNDMFIAAHALALDATLVTDNVREFERVPGLRVENWLR